MEPARTPALRPRLGPLLTAVLLLASAACGGPAQERDGSGSRPRPPEPVERQLGDKHYGPYEVRTDSFGSDAVDGDFGGGTLHYPAGGPAPTADTTGRHGVIAASPGLGADESMVAWFGELLASHGFVTITLNTRATDDTADERAGQLRSALDYAAQDSAAADRADPRRLGVLGHSAGGGGALVAAAEHREIRAAVALTPYYDGAYDWARVRAPALVIGGEQDEVAPVTDHAEPMYRGTRSAEKAYLSLDGDHFVTNTPGALVAEQTVAWFKRFVDDDRAAGRVLCPPPEPDGTGLLATEHTCPHP
ncbi:Lipase 1 [Streptomyces sp. YIM 130001]|uniref:poly(ethylene terephthalate) hydrolase family protein n=1 Tax=Streptomyces sp. YIM 130001 TaxID=2259644 RepID=UPI000E646CC6|nr:alpha/beta hydrolase [Streptomyces sp. YIM 130001]RII20402.1 Lipase 1 [Streptomyces sp. YIM 130001]